MLPWSLALSVTRELFFKCKVCQVSYALSYTHISQFIGYNGRYIGSTVCLKYTYVERKGEKDLQHLNDFFILFYLFFKDFFDLILLCSSLVLLQCYVRTCFLKPNQFLSMRN